MIYRLRNRLFFAIDLILWHHSIGDVGAGLATVLANVQVVLVPLVAWAVLIWFGVAVVASLAVPLDWQRYYLPLILVAIVVLVFLQRETHQP